MGNVKEIIYDYDHRKQALSVFCFFLGDCPSSIEHTIKHEIPQNSLFYRNTKRTQKDTRQKETPTDNRNRGSSSKNGVGTELPPRDH